MNRQTTRISPADVDRQRDFCQKLHERFAARPSAPLAFVDTYGCQQNEADSERIRGYLREMGFGFTDDEEQARVIVINTCAIREHAEQRVFGNLGALTHTKKENPEQVICLCGCMAQEAHVAEKIKQSFRHVDLVFGPHALWRFPEFIHTLLTQRGRVFQVAEEAGSISEGIPVVRQDRVKAWVSIMYGCNNFCSYCIVPYVRGRERSRDPQAVLAEVRQLVEAGYKDITLLGQNVNSYGNDLDLDYHFPDLLADIDRIPGEYLIRFMSSHPKDATPRLFDVMAASSHVAKQLHLPFQSGNDRVLKEMNRRYTRQQYLDLVNYAKRVMPGLVLTSDVIIGFPGETEEDFQATLDLIQRVKYMQLFTFIYSKRTGTIAAKLPDPATHAEKAARMDRLLKLQDSIAFPMIAAMAGQTVKVLVEAAGRTPGTLNGRLDNNLVVEFPAEESLIGQYANVRLTGSRAALLVGELAE